MRHKRKIVIFVLLFLGAIVFFAPFLIQIKPVRLNLTLKLSSIFNTEVELKEISWSWFPSPHIALRETEIINEEFNIKLSHTTVYPRWSVLLHGKPEIKKIELFDPKISIKTLRFPKKRKDTPLIIPSELIFIKKGCLDISLDKTFEGSTALQPVFEFSDIDAIVKSEHGRIDIQLSSNPPFAKRIIAKGSLMASNENTDSGDQPQLDLKIKAEGINLTELREEALVLSGSNKIVSKACSIILGGDLKEAAFSFKGKPRDLKRANSIIFTGEADHCTIHVPKGGLLIEDACGAIKIQDGVLSGHDLSARVGNSKGKAASITLDLIGEDKGFQLDVDIDADMSELPVLLRNMVRNERFKDELSRVENIKGRALGHLHLGDKLKKISVGVNILDSNCTINYQRLMHPVRVKTGRFEILPKKKEMIWKGVKAMVGQHNIYDSLGSIRWDEDAFLEIEKLNASLDSAILYSELKSYPELKRRLSKILLAIEGPVEVKDLLLKGNVKEPLKWEYNVSIDAKGLKIHSPFFPMASLVKSALIEADQKNIRIPLCKIVNSDQEIDLKGDFNHKHWLNWEGQLKLNGVMSQDLARWIKSKGWIPLVWFPYTPCRLTPLDISFYPNKNIEIIGEIITQRYSKSPVHTKIDLRAYPGGFSLRGLRIDTLKEASSLSLNFQKTLGISLYGKFKGRLPGNALDSVLEENNLLTGYIKGECTFKYDIKNLPMIQINGPLELKGFRYKLESKKEIFIDYAIIRGNRSEILIENINFMLNKERLGAKGRLSTILSKANLNLDVKSDFLSWKNLSRFIQEREENPISTDRLSIAPGSSYLSLTGRIGFEIDRFKYEKAEDSISSDTIERPVQFVWQPLIGEINLLNEDKKSLVITSGKICGCETTGTSFFDSNQTAVSFSIACKEETARFEDIFSCLGSDFEKIEGPFRLNANLEGTPYHWKKGSMRLRSKNGRIKAMTLLTRILSVVNVLDLFSENVLENFFTEGFRYTDMKIKGDIKDNIFRIDQARIKGDGMNLFGSGKVDLGKATIDCVILVAPFKVIDSTLAKLIPLGFSGGKGENIFIAIPVGVKGAINDPEVTLLSSHAVSESLLNFVKNTMMLPLNILSPILPK
ncbi:MAG: AsmA-like C-terminal domain-containing protein [Thermodesulfobacteriota bacterium]|nr:AsmA-like C-terminal domain-containing protein [Thermodesulfobacteriota bacterium]